MHIQVGDILAQDLGYRKDFEVADEQPELEDVVLDGPVSGRVSLTRLDNGVGVSAQMQASQVVDCHRCLQPYGLHQTLHFKAQFSQAPGGEELPITKQHTIDIAPLVREEMILGIPIKQLCRPDCAGINPETGKAFEKVKKVDAESSSA